MAGGGCGDSSLAAESAAAGRLGGELSLPPVAPPGTARPSVANTRQMMCVIAATLSSAVPHHSLAPASVRHRSPAPRLSDPPSAPLGHVFVLHADLRSLLTDATLYPTTDPVDSGWFPNAQRQNDPPPLPPFTSRQRVHQLPGTPAGAPLVFLANVDGRLEPQRDCEPFTGRPPLDWFVDAARQFLQLAAASVGEEGTRARCRRAQPLLALPVVGTGNGGARTASGRMISRLLEVLYDFTAARKPTTRRRGGE